MVMLLNAKSPDDQGQISQHQDDAIMHESETLEIDVRNLEQNESKASKFNLHIFG